MVTASSSNPPDPRDSDPAGIPIPADDGAEVADDLDETRVRRQRRGFFRRRVDDAPVEELTGVIPAIPPVEEPASEQALGDTSGDPHAVTVAEEPLPRGPKLRRDREHLVTQREELLFHLGGLMYDLYQRDMLSFPAAAERARRVAEVDDAIREIDLQLTQLVEARRARNTRPAPMPAEVGCCMACRAVFYADARFCMQCGSALLTVPGVVPTDEQQTRVLLPTPPSP